jgi:hypothetical protein
MNHRVVAPGLLVALVVGVFFAYGQESAPNHTSTLKETLRSRRRVCSVVFGERIILLARPDRNAKCVL